MDGHEGNSAPRVNQMTVTNPESIADVLLYDINVEIGVDYADETREQFPFFQPAYRRNADLPLGERLYYSYKTLDAAPRLLVRAGVIESLRRCAMQWLGMWRSLEVFDLHQSVAPEALSDATASRLLSLRNPDDSVDRALWLELLIRRWSESGISPEVENGIWLRVVNDVQVSGLIPCVRYLATGPLRGSPNLLACIGIAAERLRRQAADRLVEDLELLHAILVEAIPGEAYRLAAESCQLQEFLIPDHTRMELTVLHTLIATSENDGWKVRGGLGLAELSETQFALGGEEWLGPIQRPHLPSSA